jgi:ubiquinone/menaquinone biosynthesis C-methylase UbiE
MSARPDVPYSLGHSERERQRLKRQALLYESATLHVFRRAGIAPGMRVLDIGCGVGDVSFVARQLVGEAGAVMGIDRGPEAIGEARERAHAAGLTNVHFEVNDCNSFPHEEKFDALVGRLVLMYQREPENTLRSLSGLLRSGGRVAFLEYDMGLAPVSYPPNELFEQTCNVVRSTFAKTGGRLRMGAELYSTFIAAGLPAPELHVEIPAGAGTEWVAYEMVAEVTRTLLPAMEKLGLATAQEMKIDTLADRLRNECVRQGSVTFAPAIVGAWTAIARGQ